MAKYFLAIVMPIVTGEHDFQTCLKIAWGWLCGSSGRAPARKGEVLSLIPSTEKKKKIMLDIL
jgi:hypothetical protein